MSFVTTSAADRGHLARDYPARLLAVALWAGALVGLAALAEGSTVRPGFWHTAFLGVITGCAVIGALVWFRGSSWSPSTMLVVLVLLDALVVITVLCSRNTDQADLHTLLLLPPALYAAAYLPRPYVRTHEGAIVLASGATMAVAAGSPMQWLGFTAVPAVALIGASELVMALRLSLEEALAELARVSATDPLTGLLNRRGLQQRLQGHHFLFRAVLVLDVDHFKEINDTLGHAVGDEVLVALAHALRAVVPEPDLVARVGGEEFVVVTTTDERLDVYAERVRARVVEVMRPWGRTLSVGAAAAESDDVRQDLDPVLHRADHALYAAKAAGRDRSVVEPTAPVGLLDGEG